MRVALVSDAHGNAVGLRAALDDLAGRDVDTIVSLGDMAQGGPQPVECLDLLRAAGALTVLGNSDEFLLDLEAEGVFEDAPTERHLLQREWTLAQLADGDLAYLRSFKRTVELDVDGRRLLCFHGTPDGYGIVLPSDPTDRFDGTGADLLAGGHVHIQQLRRVGDALYVNPGSVGCGYGSVEPEGFHYDSWASYAVVDGTSVQFHRVPFDLDELAEATRASGLPMADHTLSLYRR